MADLRPLEPGDLPALAAIQNAVFAPLFRESQEILASRLTVAAPCCWGAFESGALLAYILSHPWPAGEPPAIGTLLSPPPPGDNWFVHDLAIGPAARGLGLGRRLVRAAAGAAMAQGLTRGDLVAVQGAWPFWEKMGYAPPAELSPALRAKMAGYGDGALYMTARLSGLKA